MEPALEVWFGHTHWRKLIFSFQAGINCKFLVMFGTWCALFLLSAGTLSSLSLCRYCVCCHCLNSPRIWHRKCREQACIHGHRKGLSEQNPSCTGIRLAINKLDMIKFKSFSTAKYTNIWSEKEPREGGKILYNLHLMGSKVHKELKEKKNWTS